jgi:hypothetical protein
VLASIPLNSLLCDPLALAVVFHQRIGPIPPPEKRDTCARFCRAVAMSAWSKPIPLSKPAVADVSHECLGR